MGSAAAVAGATIVGGAAGRMLAPDAPDVPDPVLPQAPTLPQTPELPEAVMGPEEVRQEVQPGVEMVRRQREDGSVVMEPVRSEDKQQEIEQRRQMIDELMAAAGVPAEESDRVERVRDAYLDYFEQETADDFAREREQLQAQQVATGRAHTTAGAAATAAQRGEQQRAYERAVTEADMLAGEEARAMRTQDLQALQQLGAIDQQEAQNLLQGQQLAGQTFGQQLGAEQQARQDEVQRRMLPYERDMQQAELDWQEEQSRAELLTGQRQQQAQADYQADMARHQSMMQGAQTGASLGMFGGQQGWFGGGGGGTTQAQQQAAQQTAARHTDPVAPTSVRTDLMLGQPRHALPGPRA